MTSEQSQFRTQPPPEKGLCEGPNGPAEDPSAAVGPDSSLPARLASTQTTPKIVLTIAGFDPSSGAGLTADLKVFAAHRLYGVAAATALTVQSTRGVYRVEPIPAGVLAEALDRLAEDLPIDGIKIGMLATRSNVDAVADFLERRGFHSDKRVPIILDPVLRSSSGHALLDSAGLDRLRARLLPFISCVTPNTSELFLLADAPGSSNLSEPEAIAEQIEMAAARIMKKIPSLAIVATGGHLHQPVDCVFPPGEALEWLPGEWVHTSATHGTGCAYSSALLSNLVSGLPLVQAARAAKTYITQALRAATPIGQGGGSMHHLYAAFPAALPAQGNEEVPE